MKILMPGMRFHPVSYKTESLQRHIKQGKLLLFLLFSSPELDGKTLSLKIPHAVIAGHLEINWA